ncbi:MAG: SAM hydrolase/SAM-dependent halogenase family protein [Coriobacteriia bacterium]
MQNIVCFVSDFGLSDGFVGVCHAVIASACPQARVVDLSHGVPPFDIRKGAAIAATGVFQLPEAIHLVVVDPGVGGGRKDVCIVTQQGTKLVGPDNGVLIPAAERGGGIAEAYSIDPAKIDFKPPLATFHARDVLAPAAAALACGVEPASLGRRIDAALLEPGPFGQCVLEGTSCVGEVVDVDHFGSIRLNVTRQEIEQMGSPAELEFGFGHVLIDVPVGTTFSSVPDGEPVAVFDSSGWLTLALNSASAAERYGVEPGTPAHVGLRNHISARS